MSKLALLGITGLVVAASAVAFASSDPCWDIYCPKGCYVDTNKQAHCCDSAPKKSCLVADHERDEKGCPSVEKIECYSHECCMPDGSCQALQIKQVYKLLEDGSCQLQQVTYCPSEEPQDECRFVSKCSNCDICQNCDESTGTCINDDTREGQACGENMTCQSGVCTSTI